jgi:outer membrane lipoprotein LolB
MTIKILRFTNIKLKLYAFIIVLTGSIFILTSCATIDSPNTPVLKSNNVRQSWGNYKQILTTLENWKATGVIGIVVNKKGESANFIWQQDQKDFYIQLYGPMGLGAVSLKGNDDLVTLTQNNGTELSANSATDLMDKTLGWNVPVTGLYYWGIGTYDPSSAKVYALNQFGLLASLQQNGWNITLSKYKLYMGKYPLPGKITLIQGNLKIKIIIKSWQLKT